MAYRRGSRSAFDELGVDRLAEQTLSQAQAADNPVQPVSSPEQALPADPLLGNRESPREVFQPQEPTRPPEAPRPPDVREREPESSTSSAPSPEDGASYTPARPRTPEPVAQSDPVAFTPLQQTMDPAALTVSLRAPSMSEPTSGVGMTPPTNPTPSPVALRPAPFSSPVQQYGGGGEEGRLFSRSQGLLGGGQGVLGDTEPINDDNLDALIRILMQNG